MTVHIIDKTYYIRRQGLTALNFSHKIIEVTELEDIMYFTYLEDSSAGIVPDSTETTFLPNDELGCQAFLSSQFSRVWAVTEDLSSLSKGITHLGI